MQKKTILFIDDDEAFREAMIIILESKGFSIIAEKDSTNIEKIISLANFDIAIIDYHLPNEDGLSIAQKLRKSLKKRIPIVIISSHNGVKDEVKKSNLRYFFPKPLDFGKFLNFISSL